MAVSSVDDRLPNVVLVVCAAKLAGGYKKRLFAPCLTITMHEKLLEGGSKKQNSFMQAIQLVHLKSFSSHHSSSKRFNVNSFFFWHPRLWHGCIGISAKNYLFLRQKTTRPHKEAAEASFGKKEWLRKMEIGILFLTNGSRLKTRDNHFPAHSEQLL